MTPLDLFLYVLAVCGALVVVLLVGLLALVVMFAAFVWLMDR